MLHKKAWVATLLGTLLGVQDYNKVKFPGRVNSSLAVKGLIWLFFKSYDSQMHWELVVLITFLWVILWIYALGNLIKHLNCSGNSNLTSWILRMWHLFIRILKLAYHFICPSKRINSLNCRKCTVFGLLEVTLRLFGGHSNQAIQS